MATKYVAKTGNDTTGDGSSGNPWLTIAKGLETMGVADTLEISDGVYYEGAINASGFSNFHGTDAAHPLIVKAANSGGVSLDGTVDCTSISTGSQAWGAIDTGGADAIFVNNTNSASIKKINIPTTALPRDGDGVALPDYFMIFEDNVHGLICRTPDQDVGYGYDTSKFLSLPAAAVGQKDYLFDDIVSFPVRPTNKADNYWAGSYVDLWSHGAANHIVRRTVASNDQSAQTITFTAPLVFDTDARDKYSMVNHPDCLSKAGEFYFVTTDSGTTYDFYYWPRSTDNLTNGKIRMPSKTYGIYTVDQSYITFDGLVFSGFLTAASFGLHLKGSDGLTVGNIIKNCIARDTQGEGFWLTKNSGSVIDGCRTERVGDHGILLQISGTGNTVQNCRTTDADGSGIYANGETTLSIINNIFDGSSGVHGNGLALQNGCTGVLIARNTFRPHGNITFSDVTNVILFANTIDAARLYNMATLSFNSHCGGYIAYINNVIVRQESDYACRNGFLSPWSTGINYVVGDFVRAPNVAGEYQLQPYKCIKDNNSDTILLNNAEYWTPWTQALETETPSTWLPNIYNLNNIVNGSDAWIIDTTINGQICDYNIYVEGLAYFMDDISGWATHQAAATQETIMTSKPLTDIFTNYLLDDYTLKATSPTFLHKGLNPSTLLTTLGIPALFPNFDFTLDKSGTTNWATNRAIGAYEYPIVPDADTTPPTPNPPTWDQVPIKVGNNFIAMAASHETDSSGDPVFYQYERNGVEGNWLDSSYFIYMDNYLPNGNYRYRVRAKDTVGNITDWSVLSDNIKIGVGDVGTNNFDSILSEMWEW